MPQTSIIGVKVFKFRKLLHAKLSCTLGKSVLSEAHRASLKVSETRAAEIAIISLIK